MDNPAHYTTHKVFLHLQLGEEASFRHATLLYLQYLDNIEVQTDNQLPFDSKMGLNCKNMRRKENKFF